MILTYTKDFLGEENGPNLPNVKENKTHIAIFFNNKF
jgi:hypothetical protein